MCKGCKKCLGSFNDTSRKILETAHCYDDVANGYHNAIVYKHPENKYN